LHEKKKEEDIILYKLQVTVFGVFLSHQVILLYSCERTLFIRVLCGALDAATTRAAFHTIPPSHVILTMVPLQ
jgi:hypothetical protein